MTTPEFDPKGNNLPRWEIIRSPTRIVLFAQAAVYRQVRLWLLNSGANPLPAAFADQGNPSD